MNISLWHRKFLFVGLISAFFSQPVTAEFPKQAKIEVKSEQGKTEFRAVGRPQAIKIRGEGSGPSGVITILNGQVSGDLSIDLSSFKTGIKLRDDHMKNKYLEIKKYPEAKLHIKKVGIDISGNLDQDDVPFEADLSLHGETASVMGTAKIKINSEKAEVKASFSFNVKNFKIPTPSFSDITMTEVVQVEVSFTTALSKTK